MLGHPRSGQDVIAMRLRYLKPTAFSFFLSSIPAVQAAIPAVMDFETVSVGTKYGAEYGQMPGQEVLTQNGIDMSIEQFRLGSFVGFIRAEIGGRYAGSFPSTPLDIDNIAVRFDFSGVGFPVSQVSLDFQEFGGADNFEVNGSFKHHLNQLADLPTQVAPGVTATVIGDEIRLVGPISNFQIGGQELAIDNVVAVPEPTAILLLGIAASAALLRRRSH